MVGQGNAGARQTGYGRVLQSLMAHLHQAFEILHFSLDYRGEPLAREYRLLPNRLIGDLLGRQQLPDILDAFQPRDILLCHDVDFYAVHRQALGDYRRRHPAARVFFYCPIETADYPAANFLSLADVDALVLYTEFGRGVVRAAFQTLGLTDTPPLMELPHGVDAATFYPLVAGERAASRRQARAQLFPDRRELQDAFLVLNANRNNRRKRVDLTLRAFAEFARDKADAYLYLHMGMRDYGYDLLTLAEELEVRERLLLTTTEASKPAIADAHLNLIYNACDVGINTATGEGWGLVAFEHAATGAAQLVPQHTACAELWRDDGILLPLQKASPSTASTTSSLPSASISSSTSGSSSSPSSLPETAPDIHAAAATLDRLYRDRQALDELSARALAYATAERFAWKNIAARWAALFSRAAESV